VAPHTHAHAVNYTSWTNIASLSKYNLVVPGFNSCTKMLCSFVTQGSLFDTVAGCHSHLLPVCQAGEEARYKGSQKLPNMSLMYSNKNLSSLGAVSRGRHFPRADLNGKDKQTQRRMQRIAA